MQVSNGDKGKRRLWRGVLSGPGPEAIDLDSRDGTARNRIRLNSIELRVSCTKALAGDALILFVKQINSSPALRPSRSLDF